VNHLCGKEKIFYFLFYSETEYKKVQRDIVGVSKATKTKNKTQKATTTTQ